MAPRSRLDGAASVMAYSTCSISMILLNKLVTTTYGLNFPSSLLLLQSAGALFLVCLAKALKLISYPPFYPAVARRWFPLTLLFFAMLLTSVKSLHLMSVPTQTVLKNLALIPTALGDRIVFGKQLSMGMYAAFALMVLGSFWSVTGDAWVSARGLFWTFLNVAATVSYTLYMKYLMKEVGSIIGNYGPVLYSNLLSSPLFLLVALTETGFIPAISQAPLGGLLCLLLSILVSSFMTFAVFWCMGATSPTTLSVAGAVNKAPVALAGIVLFGNSLHPMGYVGIAASLAGGFLYTMANLRPPVKSAQMNAVDGRTRPRVKLCRISSASGDNLV